MSIIEKAASRIDHTRAPAPAPVAVEHNDEIVVLQPQVAPATPAAAAAPAASVGTPRVATPRADTPRAEAPRRTAAKPGARKVDLDLNRMRDAGLVTAASGRTSLLEDFRVIKRPLLKR
ncbi:MAG: protein-tyrosine kinase, partial [Massilia sp.]